MGENEWSSTAMPREQVVVDRLDCAWPGQPRIEGQVQPYSINHNVARSEWATNACQDCHRSDSVIAQPLALASNFARWRLTYLCRRHQRGKQRR
ncbi:MAG: hypothetical protein R2867_20315 [Caldilineaceae bacterium]